MTTRQATSGTPRRRSAVSTRGIELSAEALQEATARAAVVWRKECSASLTELDAAELPQAIIAAIWQGGERGAVDARLRSPHGRRLLDLVRAELLQVWDGCNSTSSDQMLSALQAIEATRAAIDPDEGEEFVDRLAAVDGAELLVGVAHDLRSPLTSILFLAETLQRGLSGNVNDLQHRQLGLIYGAALGLSEMASNAIELIRGGNRLAEEEPSPFSIRETFDSILDITRPLAEEKGLVLRINPPPTDHRLGHPLAISRVLLNLTTNALKFTDQGLVELVARETGLARIEFSVRDSGNGITPDALETLYSPMRRNHDGTGVAFSGTGLGLALCRRLVTAMGSQLHCESKPDWGTRFHFELELRPILNQ